MLLLYGILRRCGERDRILDWCFALFVAAFLLAHTVLEFNVWDRYLLGLVPCVSLLLARVLVLPGDVFSHFWPGLRRWRVAYGLAAASLLLLTLLRPAQDAAQGHFPIGGDHGAYRGLDALVNYYRGHVPGGAVVYHRWLGWHYSFYLFDFPYRFQWYASPEELARDAADRPDAPRYVAFPSWRSSTQTQWVLKQAGLALHPVYETYRGDGSRSFTLYRVEEATADG
jgi:hypothetical protein